MERFDGFANISFAKIGDRELTPDGKFRLLLFVNRELSSKGDSVRLLEGLRDSLDRIDRDLVEVAWFFRSAETPFAETLPEGEAYFDSSNSLSGLFGFEDRDLGIALLNTWNGLLKRFTEREFLVPEIVVEEVSRLVAEQSQLLLSIRDRRARRAISTEPLPREIVEKTIVAATMAPSCMNNQSWRFLAVDDRSTLERLHEALPGGNYWMKSAPVLICVYSSIELDCQLKDRRDYYLFAAGMATGYLLLQATQMNLIAHPVAGYDPLKFKEILAIDESSVLITVVAMGRPGQVDHLSQKHLAVEKSDRQRKEIGEVFKWSV